MSHAGRGALLALIALIGFVVTWTVMAPAAIITANRNGAKVIGKSQGKPRRHGHASEVPRLRGCKFM
jgi:hypothetical protein